MAVTVASDAPVFHNVIGGRRVPSDGCDVAERRNPANVDDVIGYVPLADPPAVDDAVTAAQDALGSWRSTPAPARGGILFRVAQQLRDEAERIAALVTREQGKTLDEARGEVALAVDVLEYIGGEGRRLAGETLPSMQAGRLIWTVPQPVGIVGLITPWNFPLAVPIWKIAPALVGGNTVVWKPSRITPAISEAIVTLFDRVGVPPGVLNMVNGAGHTVGRALATHARVRAISFTSSYEVATDIYATAAKRLKKVQCEAGGKNAAIVLADADLDRAADLIAQGAFRYAGQRCTATSRVVVDRAVADRLVDALADRAHAITVGDGLDPGTRMGPIVDESQLARVLTFVEAGRREGRPICGGARLDGSAYERGWFVPPTLFDHVSPDASIAQEEIFGPVLAVCRVEGASEALDAANRNRFGMTIALFTRDLRRVLEAVDRLECGIVHVNGGTTSAEVHVPFGGIKDTGVGERELGSTAVDFYTEPKVVYLAP
jgi:aldehyde dehydrogenase (NAD+)